ncbi:MAG: hypothetical protein ACK54H_11785 [Phycisphaerales bacterium]|jgi:hypothetical protein
MDEQAEATRETEAPAVLDAGWLFLVAGLALLGATLLIPAAKDLSEAEWLRDRALAIENHRMTRLTRYEEYLGAVENRDPSLIQSLAASQLNQIPADTAVVPGFEIDPQANASVFPALEPPSVTLPEFKPVDSRLARWASNDRTRIWLLAGSVLMIMIGLLPPSKGWRGRDAQA